MRLRLGLITLGVGELPRARQFYERMGLRASSSSTDEVAFFQLGNAVLALWGRAALAADATVTDSRPGFSGVALAWNVPGPQAVDQALKQAVASGGAMVKPAQATAWGGYSGYFADPDGHLWEVAHNPFFPLDDEGRVALPDDGAPASNEA